MPPTPSPLDALDAFARGFALGRWPSSPRPDREARAEDVLLLLLLAALAPDPARRDP